jgi:hypothetical protein
MNKELGANETKSSVIEEKDHEWIQGFTYMRDRYKGLKFQSSWDTHLEQLTPKSKTLHNLW